MTSIEKIEKLLAAKGWKQNAFEKAAVLAENRISEWKDGEGEPTLRQALRIARLLQVPLEYLADDSLDEPLPSTGVTPDEAAILDLFRALRLDKAEGLRRLASPPSGQQQAARHSHGSPPGRGKPEDQIKEGRRRRGPKKGGRS